MVSRKNEMTRKIFSELFGSAILSLFTSGLAIMVQASTFNTGGFFITVLSSTLVMFVLQELLYEISGAHLNPAVSLVELLERRIKMSEFIAYLFAQAIGVVTGTALVLLYTTDAATISYGTSTYVQGDVAKTIAFGVISTGIFTWAVLSAFKKENRSLLIAIAFGASNLISMVLSGGGINPFSIVATNLMYMICASDFSTAVILPILAGTPMLGGIFGWVIYSILLSNGSKKPKKQNREKTKKKEETNEEGTFLDEFGNEWTLENGIPVEKKKGN